MKKNKNKGFTIIELMAVVAILSILAVIALSVYGDYIIRTKVAEGIGFAGEARTSVSEYYYNTRTLPANNDEAGLPAAAQYQHFDFINRLEITTQPKPGTITVTFKLIGTPADNKVLQLIPSTRDGIVSWTCLPAVNNGIAVNHVPPNCRG